MSLLVRVALGLVVLAGALRAPREPPPAPPPRPRGFAGRYGASPLHLLVHVAVLAAVLAVVARVADAREVGNALLWFALAVLVHDALLLPAYSLLDRLAARAAPGPAVNHLRVPAVLSGLLLLVFFPLVLGCSQPNLERVTGEPADDRLVPWLLITAALFAGSALHWLLRGRRSAARRRRAP